MDEARRFRLALAASATVHVLVLAALARTFVAERPVRVIPVALVARLGGGGGGDGGSPPAATPPAEAAPPRAEMAPVAPRRRVARAPRPAPAAAPADASAATGGEGGTGAGGGAGSGGSDGSGGDGSGGARAAYGTNPLPPYPLVARRLGMEGVVLLDVLVAPDGHAAEVRVARSSGFPPLDDAAAKTVRERWRFIPAARAGSPVESRVTVPIRFRLDDARG